MWKVLIGVLMCVTATFCSEDYVCDKENDGLYIAANTIHCRVYFYCDGIQFLLRICSKGESFDLDSKTCVNSSLVYCPEDEPEEPAPLRNKYFARRPPYNSRVKRQVSINGQRMSILESILAFADPVIAQVLPAVRPVFITQENTVKNKIILPIVFDMLQDDETRQDLRRIFFVTKKAFRPILMHMLRQQAFGTPRGTVIHVPKNEIAASRETFDTQARPLIRKVAEKYWSVIFNTAAEHTDILLDAVDNLEEAAEPYAPELRQRIVDFMAKHGSLFLKGSNDTEAQTYTLQEIKEDLIPIGRLLMEIFIDKMSREPRSIFSSFFSRNSVLYLLLNADVPSNSVYRLDPRFRNNPAEPIMPMLFNMLNSVRI